MILIILSLLLGSITILVGKGFTKIAFSISTILLAIVGFLFNPYLAQTQGVYTDLVRFFNELTLLDNATLNQVVTSTIEPFKTEYPGLLINNIVMYIVAKIKIYNLLPCIAVLFFYGILYVQLYKECKKYSINKYNILLLFWMVYALINITEPMDNIRNPISSLVGVILLYNNLISKFSTPLTFLGYLLIYLIHPSAIIFPIVNIIVKIKNKFIKYILIVITFIMTIFSNSISSNFSGNNTVIFNKIFAYTGGQSDLINYGTSFQKLLLWISAFVLIFIIYLFNKYTEENTTEFTEAIILFIAMFLGASVVAVHIFFRLGFMLNIFILTLLPSVLSNYNENKGILKSDRTTRVLPIKLVLYILLGLTIILNLSWYFGTYAYRSINLGG